MSDTDKTATHSISRRLYRAVLIVAATGFLVLFAIDLYASSVLEQAFAAARARDEPVTWSEAVPAFPVPDGQNAALFYARAQTLLPPLVLRSLDYEFGYSPLLSDAQLAQCGPAIGEVRRATRITLCRFPEALSLGRIPGWFACVGQIRSLTSVMSQQALAEIEHGATAQALADINTVFVMSRRLAAVPYRQPYSAGVGFESVGYHDLARILEIQPKAAPAVKALLAAQPSPKWADAEYKRMMLADRALTIERMERGRSRVGPLVPRFPRQPTLNWLQFNFESLARPVTSKLREAALISGTSPDNRPRTPHTGQTLFGSSQPPIPSRHSIYQLLLRGVGRNLVRNLLAQRPIILGRATFPASTAALPDSSAYLPMNLPSRSGLPRVELAPETTLPHRNQIPRDLGMTNS